MDLLHRQNGHQLPSAANEQLADNADVADKGLALPPAGTILLMQNENQPNPTLKRQWVDVDGKQDQLFNMHHRDDLGGKANLSNFFYLP
jgi:hypothetical protein